MTVPVRPEPAPTLSDRWAELGERLSRRLTVPQFEIIMTCFHVMADAVSMREPRSAPVHGYRAPKRTQRACSTSHRQRRALPPVVTHQERLPMDLVAPARKVEP